MRYNFNKGINLYKCCSYDDLRPVMNCILFQDNNAIASDGRIIVVAPLSEISNLVKEDMEKLNGKLIYRDAFKEILRYDRIKEIDNEGIILSRESNEFSIKVLFNHSDISKYPDYKKAMEIENNYLKGEIGFSITLLSNICDSVNKRQPIVTPNGEGRALKVRFTNSKIKALIMPFLFD